MRNHTPRALPLGWLMTDVGGLELTAEERDFLKSPAVGGVILFARNYRDKKQLAELIQSIKQLRTPALWVGVDQEGGRVQRFRRGFRRLPAAAEGGKLYDHDPPRARRFAESTGRFMAAELRAIGADFSFAPVLDCANPASEVIGDRAFHHNPRVVCELASAFIRGMRAAGMAAVGKHFPGHGGVAADSHHTLPTDPRGLRALERRDLIPFARLHKQLGGVMTAHVRFPKIHPRPPTYSKFWLQEILRARLKFNGLIFSDDLNMRGAAAGLAAGAGKVSNDDEIDMAARCEAALTAGCDMVLVCNNAAGARAAAEMLREGPPRTITCAPW